MISIFSSPNLQPMIVQPTFQKLPASKSKITRILPKKMLVNSSKYLIKVQIRESRPREKPKIDENTRARSSSSSGRATYSGKAKSKQSESRASPKNIHCCLTLGGRPASALESIASNLWSSTGSNSLLQSALTESFKVWSSWRTWRLPKQVQAGLRSCILNASFALLKP